MRTVSGLAWERDARKARLARTAKAASNRHLSRQKRGNIRHLQSLLTVTQSHYGRERARGRRVALCCQIRNGGLGQNLRARGAQPAMERVRAGGGLAGDSRATVAEFGYGSGRRKCCRKDERRRCGRLHRAGYRHDARCMAMGVRASGVAIPVAECGAWRLTAQIAIPEVTFRVTGPVRVT